MKIIKKTVPVTRFEERTVGFELEAYVSRFSIADPHIPPYDNLPRSTKCTMSFDGTEVEFILQDGPDAFQLRNLVSGAFSPKRPPKYKITIEKEEFIEEQSECRRKALPKHSV